MKLTWCRRGVVLLLASTLARAAPVPAPSPAASAESDELYKLGQQLFEQLATPELRAQFEFPTKEKWDAFAARFDRAMTGDSLEDLAALAADARAALGALRMVPGYDDLADWLEQRIDEFEGAGQAVKSERAPAPGAPQRPGTPGAAPAAQPLPHYALWLGRVRARPLPAGAGALMPTLRAAFAREGVPAELVWLAEAESSLNPRARSPAGAKGLFQLMPDTAKAAGLSTFLPDERTDPEKSARAAARLLRTLHGKFGNWALALAAYNAGEGRVARTLAARNAKTFTAIADALPAETRMYVPKVCALIETRAGVPPQAIGAAAR